MKKFGIVKNKAVEIKNITNKYLIKKINFKTFPIPNLELSNVQANVKNTEINLDIKKLVIFPKLISIYNFENFQTNKLILKNNSTILETSNVMLLIKNLLEQKSKLSLNNLDLSVTNENKFILNLKNINFTNYGYNKNLIQGKIFGKKFKTSIDDNLKYINFKLIGSGVNAFINFDIGQKQNLKSGIFGAKILNTKLKLNFNYNNKILEIYNSYFRSINLSFNYKALIKLHTFLKIDSRLEVEELDAHLFNNLNLIKLLEKKDILKEININNEINFKSKKFTKNLIDNLNLKFDLAYGRINYFKNFLFQIIFFNAKKY